VATGDVGDPSNGNPAGFIRGLLNEGETPTAGLAIYREAGGHIQDSRWFAMYRQVADTYADRPAMLGLDPFSLPGPEQYVEWRMGQGGQYATQVQIQILDRDTGDWLTKQFTYVTDQPHTAAEAERDAWDQFDPLNTGADYNEVMMGAVAVTFAQTIPY
jgi:hypothetical protein